jgi:ubiquinone/menaquinone biosynthesis C-methylase UbiE
MVTSARKASLRTLQYGTTAKLEARIALHRRFGGDRGSFHAWAGRHLPISGPVEILEVGCGIGALWRENLAHLAKGSRLTLTDISPAMVEQCRLNLDRGRIRFVVADGEDLPFAPACFDLVIAHHVLYHADDPTRFVAEIIRTLSGNGTVSITTNGAQHMQVIYDVARQIDPGYPSERHIDRFTEEIADQVLPRHFRVVDKHIQADVLEVTDARLLLNYVASTLDGPNGRLSDDFFAHYARIVQSEIERRGCFAVPRRSALYLCRV